MFSWIKGLFGFKKTNDDEFSDKEHEKYYELKNKGLEDVLGKQHDMVLHAIVPYQVGGPVDMYMFPNCIDGTAFVTMELIDIEGSGPVVNSLGTYELITYTKHDINCSEDDENQTEFDKVSLRLRHIMTSMGRYSEGAELKPKDTCEIPEDDEENICLLFQKNIKKNGIFNIGDKKHGLLLVIEIFRSECEYARENGSDKLVKLLKGKGYYPYSDMDRSPVV